MAEKKDEIYISVIGSSRCSEEMVQLAEQVGKAVAETGAVLVCGGLGGVMLGAARGAKRAGGMTIGLLPGTDRDEANPFIQVAVATGLGFARNALVAQAGDAVIAVDGEYGTLSEIGFALQFKKPVIGLKSWTLKKNGLENSLRRAETPEEAAKTAYRLASEYRSLPPDARIRKEQS